MLLYCKKCALQTPDFPGNYAASGRKKKRFVPNVGFLSHKWNDAAAAKGRHIASDRVESGL